MDRAGALRVDLANDEAATILADWQRQWPGMGVLALVPEQERARIPALQALCRGQGIPLVGAMFPALVTLQGLATSGAWLLRMNEMPASVLVGELAAQADPAAVIAAAVDAVLPVDETAAKPLLFMLFDAMVGNIASILDGLYVHLADSVRYAGVNAGSETFQPVPCLFDSERIVADGVLCLLLRSRAGAILKHGYPAPAGVLSATSTAGNRIDSIDWRPAFDVYRELVGREYGVDLTPENFYQYGCHFPFGIQRADGDVIVRIPVALGADGSLFCVGEVPANATLVVLRAPASEASRCTESLSASLHEANGALAGQTLLTFYCAGRRMHMGEVAADGELADLQQRSGAAIQAGALSLGEIGSTERWGYPLFHNATLVCVLWESA